MNHLNDHDTHTAQTIEYADHNARSARETSRLASFFGLIGAVVFFVSPAAACNAKQHSDAPQQPISQTNADAPTETLITFG